MRALLVLPLFLAACPAPPPPAAPPGAMEAVGPVVVTVDGLPVTQEMVDAVLKRIPPEQAKGMKPGDPQYKDLLDRIVLGQGLYKRALDEKLDQDPETQKILAMAEREILATEMLDRMGDKAVTDEAIKAAYDKHAVQFNRPSMKMQHMIVQDQAKADEVVASLKAGGDFAALAKAQSLDGGQNGGDLGWIERGRLIPELETPAFAAAKGDIVGPIKTDHGFHIMKINDVRESTPIEEVRDQLVDEVKRDTLQTYVDGLRKDMKVEWPADKAGGETPADGAAPASLIPAGDGAAAAPPGN